MGTRPAMTPTGVMDVAPDAAGAFWRGRGFCRPVFVRVIFLACCALSRGVRDRVRLASRLRLTDVGIEGWFGDTHQRTDLLHRDLFLLIELHGQLSFVRRERLGTTAEASTGPGDPQPRLGALLNQL